MADETNWFLGSVTRGSGDERLLYDPDDLTTHGVIVGMTGSGKTGLAIVTLEEAARAGIPVLVIDPKGDMTNLLLNFPDLQPSDFEPWVNGADAERDGVTRADLAAKEAEKWRSGLERDGLGSDQMRAVRDGAQFTVYTPGSTAGRSLNIIGNLAAPASGLPPEAIADEVNALVTGLLSLIGVDADPLSSREHVLLANVIHHAWDAGQDLTFETLLGQALDPPFRKLGVFDIDEFFPRADRMKLAMRLNGLLASPSFSAWMSGDPFDVGSLLWSPDGRPRVSILFIAHLSDAERQFVVSTAFAKVASWMRSQPGSPSLRALVYMDEVFGFAPPTANPPSKEPLLTLLKQARAYGVGVLLATQNPVDLDYKAMSNAGTWMIGRLQTERDKLRLVEGLVSAGGAVDQASVEALISSLEKREFLLHNTHDSGGPVTFSTRWAISYLSGPLTREQVALLPGSTQPQAVEAAPAAVSVAAAPSPTPPPAAAPLADDESNVMPAIAEGVRVYYLDPAAPWAAEVGATASGTRLVAAIVARVRMRFDETKAALDHEEEWEAVFFPADRVTDPALAITVDYDARDLRPEAPAGATYVLPAANLAAKAFFSSAERSLKDHLHRTGTLEILCNPDLKLYSRVDETPEAFATRCERQASDEADREAAKIRDRFESKMDTVRDAVERERLRVEQLETDVKTRKTSQFTSTVGDLLGAFFGGKRNARSLATQAGRIGKGVSSRSGVATRTGQRLSGAEKRLEAAGAKLEDLEADLIDEIAEIDERWTTAATAIEPMTIPLEATDVRIDEVAVLWVPTSAT